MANKSKSLLAILGPGMLIAATGVGAGDLATAAFTGSALGLGILWAVVFGAALKFVLNEGLARWQLATGDTLLEGFVERFGMPLQWAFLAYLVVWSFLVAAALMSAVGVTCHAIYPVLGENAAVANKIFYGLLHSALAVALVRLGGYSWFERIMSVCIGIMFLVVVLTAAALRPPLGELLAGLVWPTIPEHGFSWTIALMGGVGGTLTILCYGYWIREEGRQGTDDLRICRLDLAAGYLMTAVFGVSMVVIGNAVGDVSGGGATLVVEIANRLQTTFGSAGYLVRWAFLIGAWGAVFSSLLGVWQSVPYLFADFWFLTSGGKRDNAEFRVDTRSLPYQLYLMAIAVVPAAGLVAVNFKTLQKTYALVGALCIPMLALVLLILNGHARWVGARYRNSMLANAILTGTLIFFVVSGWLEIQRALFTNNQ